MGWHFTTDSIPYLELAVAENRYPGRRIHKVEGFFSRHRPSREATQRKLHAHFTCRRRLWTGRQREPMLDAFVHILIPLRHAVGMPIFHALPGEHRCHRGSPLKLQCASPRAITPGLDTHRSIQKARRELLPRIRSKELHAFILRHRRFSFRERLNRTLRLGKSCP